MHNPLSRWKLIYYFLIEFVCKKFIFLKYRCTFLSSPSFKKKFWISLFLFQADTHPKHNLILLYFVVSMQCISFSVPLVTYTHQNGPSRLNSSSSENKMLFHSLAFFIHFIKTSFLTILWSWVILGLIPIFNHFKVS